MKIVKVKIKCEKLRALCEFYGLSMQLVSRKAEISWRRSGRELFTGEYPTALIDPENTYKSQDETVLDVDDSYTLEQWREMIHTYVDREFKNLPAIHSDFIKSEMAKAEKMREESKVCLDSSSDSGGNSYKDVNRSMSRGK